MGFLAGGTWMKDDQPALAHRPTNWLLFLKITGGFYSQQNSDNLMNGPGAFAVDAQGYVWADNNFVPEPPGHFACAGTRVLKFAPSGNRSSACPPTSDAAIS